MAYTGDPANSETDRLRLQVGDTDPLDEDLSDAEYQYFIDNTTNLNAAYVEALKALVAKYAKYARERAGQVEVYGQEKYQHYQQLLDDAFNPVKGRFKMGPGITGGISKSRVKKVRENSDNNHTDLYQGWSTDPQYSSYGETGEVHYADSE